MPLTFPAHQAPVLPLKLWRPPWFDATACSIRDLGIQDRPEHALKPPSQREPQQAPHLAPRGLRAVPTACDGASRHAVRRPSEWTVRHARRKWVQIL